MNIELQKTIVITGHYGSGKTNLALNLAIYFRDMGESVTLADLDIVNPYFRTADYHDLIEQRGITVVASDYAGSTLDIPALSGKLDAVIGKEGVLIIDVGGDEVGAHVLGRYTPSIRMTDYSMLYVVNRYRYLMGDQNESISLLHEIEKASRLQVTALVNCSNLGRETTLEAVNASCQYVEGISKQTQLPISFTTVSKQLLNEGNKYENVFPVEILVKVPWE